MVQVQEEYLHSCTDSQSQCRFVKRNNEEEKTLPLSKASYCACCSLDKIIDFMPGRAYSSEDAKATSTYFVFFTASPNGEVLTDRDRGVAETGDM